SRKSYKAAEPKIALTGSDDVEAEGRGFKMFHENPLPSTINQIKRCNNGTCSRNFESFRNQER
ncbi:MAG: hypothetical protein ABEK36_00845, partial [Candidatus Aenigmatarchaeota archaeon]